MARRDATNDAHARGTAEGFAIGFVLLAIGLGVITLFGVPGLAVFVVLMMATFIKAAW